MRVRAVAVASDRSNAVGTVELECTPRGLVIVHRGVGAFHAGYAPGALTTGTTIVAPWDGVREAVWEGDRFFLHLNEALTPHHRLLLAGFSDADAMDPREGRHRRMLFRAGTAASMLLAGLLTAVTAARLSSDAGAASAILFGCLSAAVVFVLGVVLDHRLGGPTAEATARMAFGMDVSAYLPAVALSMAPGSPGRAKVALPSFPTLLPRTTTAVVITMSAALLGAILTASWLSREPHEAVRRAPPEDGLARAAAPEPVAPAAAPAAPPAAAEPPTAAAPAPTRAVAPSPSGTALLAGECTCKRADSLLWREGLPRVSTLLIERKHRTHNNHVHLELELGVVNNSDAPIPEVSLLVQFFERDPPPSKKRVPTFDRPLFFEGPLAAGQAIKWHVEARGNDFEVTGMPTGVLDKTGADAAPTGLLADLLEANHRPVRLHGAMMLAYLGDPRAKEGALGLREALREDEAPYIDRLMWALSDVRTCSIEVAEGGNPRTVRACVFNMAAEPRTGLALRVRALDRAFRHDTPVEVPPTVLAEKVMKLGGNLAPGQGGVVTVPFDASNPDGIVPKDFEVYADREELVY